MVHAEEPDRGRFWTGSLSVRRMVVGSQTLNSRLRGPHEDTAGCFSRVLWGGLSGSSDEGARQESFGVAVAAAAVDRSSLCAIAGLPEGCQGHVSPPQHGRLDCRRCVISEGSDLSSSPHHMRTEASESMAPRVSSCGSEECR